MNKLMTMVFAAVIGFSLSMPAFAQPASGQAKTGAHEMHAKSTGATVGEKEGQEGASPASPKATPRAHRKVKIIKMAPKDEKK